MSSVGLYRCLLTSKSKWVWSTCWGHRCVRWKWNSTSMAVMRRTRVKLASIKFQLVIISLHSTGWLDLWVLHERMWLQTHCWGVLFETELSWMISAASKDGHPSIHCWLRHWLEDFALCGDLHRRKVVASLKFIVPPRVCWLCCQGSFTISSHSCFVTYFWRVAVEHDGLLPPWVLSYFYLQIGKLILRKVALKFCGWM